MENSEQQRQPVRKDTDFFQFEDPREEKLYRTIKQLVGDGPAEFFKDACNLMGDDKGLSTVSHIVGHLLRELECSIYDVLMPLAQKIKGEADQKLSNARAILRALDIPESDDAAKALIDLTKREHRFQGKAHRRNLGLPRSLDDEFREDWQRLLRALEMVLDRFEKRSTDVFERLNILLEQEVPADAELNVLKEQIPNNLVAFDYFFSRLQSPDWLKPLHDEGFFCELPVDRTCPQTKYLVRMASLPECHQTAFDIVMAVETENIMVICDLAESACALPPPLAAQTVPKLKKCFESAKNLFVLPYELGKLVTHLAKGGHPAEALDLVADLLVILPAEDGADTWNDPTTRIQSNEYTGILEESIPHLAKSGGMPVFKFLCDLLATGIEKKRGQGEENNYDDLSHYWRHNLDSHEMHMSREVTNGLVTAVLDSGRKILKKDPSAMQRIVKVLDSKRWTIFQRITLQLLSESESPPQKLVAQKLLDPSLWGGDTTRREYNALAEAHAVLLTPSQREKIVRRIEAGPDMTPYEGMLEPSEVNAHMQLWRRDHLVPFRDILPPQWQQTCDDLVDELGEPVDEPKIDTASCVGNISPLVLEETQSKSVEEIVDYLKEWKPTGEWGMPDPEGLGDVVRQAVTEDPVRFAEKAELFIGIDPTYVRSVIGGLAEAMKAERAFPWNGVLQLCAWVVQQPIEIPGRASRRIHDVDPDWRWARGRIVDLLTKGLTEGNASIPFSLRTEVWDLIQGLTGDPNPTSQHETRYGGKNMNPYELAVNTVRGGAMESIIFYILWVLRELNIEAGKEERIDSGLQHVPEAAEVLESHLEPQSDPALSVRAIYGKWLPSLDYIDRDWTQRMLHHILPRDSSLRQFRNAAWNTYLLYSGGPYNKTAEILIPEYRFAIDNLSTITSIAHGDPKKALAFHIAYLYLRGILKLDGDDGIIAAFLQQADANLRGELVRVMGDIVRHNKEPSSQWIDRAMRFWELRLKDARDAEDTRQHTKEMDSFGYWFISRKFDDNWSLRNLESALQLGSNIDFDYHVVENLVSLAQKKPLECARCLQMIVKSEGKNEWDIRLLVGHVREVLVVIFAGENKEAKKVARDIIGILRARGHHEIRDVG